jgi:hypothetical protein
MCQFTIAENPNSGDVYQQLRQNKGSEDVTRITPRIEFDTASNELIGLALAIMENGLPIVSFFKVTSALQINSFIENFEMPSYVYVMMAQLLSRRIWNK